MTEIKMQFFETRCIYYIEFSVRVTTKTRNLAIANRSRSASYETQTFYLEIFEIAEMIFITQVITYVIVLFYRAL